MIVLSGTVIAVQPGRKVTRVIVAGTGRTNDQLMMAPDAKVATGDIVELPVRPSIERNRDGRVTGFITYWDQAFQPERSAAPSA